MGQIAGNSSVPRVTGTLGQVCKHNKERNRSKTELGYKPAKYEQPDATKKSAACTKNKCYQCHSLKCGCDCHTYTGAR